MSNAPLVPMMINSDLQSRPVTLIDAVSGCTLTYTITIGTTGCCAPLSLKAPALTRIDWRTRASSQSIREALAQTPYVHLPEVADQSATRMRLTANNIQVQMNPASWDYLELREPATNVDLEELTQSIEGSAPADYLQFMTCSNGMLIGEVLLLPIKDAIRFAKSYVRSIGQSVILAQDVINGLADGFWFMPVSGAKSGLVMHVDNYGKVEGNGITLAAFLQELVDRNHEYTDRMGVVPRKRLRELHPDRMHRNAVNEFYPSA